MSASEPSLPVRSVPSAEQLTADDLRQHTRRQADEIMERPEPGGRYLFRHELARGGMGIINIVKDQDVGRISAMKVMPPQLVDARQKMANFVSEARITAQLEHPNIIPVHEIGIVEESGSPFYTMKKVKGESLQDVVHKLAAGDPDYTRRFGRYRLLEIFRRVCDAVAYAHSIGVIHRDIKPENIMVGEFGEVLLMDWGLAKYLDDDQAEQHSVHDPWPTEIKDLTVTEDGMIKGSIAYISPEQAFGEVEEIDEQTDIFLLGATLYHLFTHHPPYIADELADALAMAEQCAFVPPAERNPDARIPKALERIIITAMAPLKPNRFATVQQLSNEIEAFINGRRVCDCHVFAKGDPLVTSGDQGADTYIITKGSVAVHAHLHGRDLHIADLGPGDVVGEMAAISHSVRSATVTARETTEVLVITRDLMEEELQKLPPWMEKIIFAMSHRVRTLDRLIHPLLTAGCVFPVVNQFYCIFLTGSPAPQVDAQCRFTVESIVEELYLSLGLGGEITTMMVKILIGSGLAALNEEDEVVVPDLFELGRFVDFCRHSLEIPGGIKQIRELNFPPETLAYFRSIRRRLETLATAPDA